MGNTLIDTLEEEARLIQRQADNLRRMRSQHRKQVMDMLRKNTPDLNRLIRLLEQTERKDNEDE